MIPPTCQRALTWRLFCAVRVPPYLYADKDVVSAVCWAPFGELFTCSDDNTICRWSRAGECLGTVTKVEDTNVTAIHWFPSVGSQVSDLFAISCTDGALAGGGSWAVGSGVVALLSFF